MHRVSQTLRNREVHFELNTDGTANLDRRTLLENAIFLLNDHRFYFRDKEISGPESTH